jgi:uncharacterized protein (DUF2062 family)/SAM-dependent methyltransferase
VTIRGLDGHAVARTPFARTRKGHSVIRRIKLQGRKFITLLLEESLDPGRAAAAVFLGTFIGIIPIYGFQTLAAVGVAVLFKLNKPLTVAATFINNPLLLPLIIFSSVELGCLLRTGSFQRLNMATLIAMRAHINKEQAFIWIIGSVALGVLAGAVGAAITAIVVQRRHKASDLRPSGNSVLDARVRFVNALFSQCKRSVREFVRWKLRLDKVFEILAAENLGSGTVVDLGCGYGMALCFAASDDNRRRLVGCDIDARRIAVARQALGNLNADLSAADARIFEIPAAELILILDVLHYFPAAEQAMLLKRCCSALTPNGILIFRVPDRGFGLRSKISMVLERLVFASEGNGFRRPHMLPVVEYRTALQDADLQLEERRFQNHLPLSHVLFIARKTLAAVGD